MPHNLRQLSGQEVVKILQGFGFVVFSQHGSHVKLRRTGAEKGKQTLVIPVHRRMHQGTLSAIFRQACQYVAEEELRPHFYAE